MVLGIINTCSTHQQGSVDGFANIDVDTWIPAGVDHCILLLFAAIFPRDGDCLPFLDDVPLHPDAPRVGRPDEAGGG
jgi:hypothetical protein